MSWYMEAAHDLCCNLRNLNIIYLPSISLFALPFRHRLSASCLSLALLRLNPTPQNEHFILAPSPRFSR